MRSLRSPRWIVAHLAVVVLPVAFITLGFWQLRRLDERRAHNTIFVAREHQPAEDVTALLPARRSEAEFRRVTARGRYDTAHEVVLLSRSFDGLSGHHVVTPLVTARGDAILVDRGWVPIDDETPPVAAALPPSTIVTVTGVLYAAPHRGLFSPRDPATGALTQIRRLDPARLAPQMPYTLMPLWLQLEKQDPAQSSSLPKVVPLESIDEGPHLNYAIQWFSFAAIALATYVALILAHRRARSRASAAR